MHQGLSPLSAKFRRLTGLLILPLLSACVAVGPDYQPPAPELPANWHTRQAAPTGTPDPLPRWWSRFDDPRLDQLIDEATRSNPDLKIAASRIRQARASLGIARGGMLPTLDAGGAATNSGRSRNIDGSGGSSQNLFRAGFDAGWEIDLWGGVRRAGEAAQARLQAAEESRTAVLTALQAEVARSYFELRGNQRRLAIAEKSIDTLGKILALAEARYKQGLSSRLDALQAATQLAQSRAQIPLLHNNIGQAAYRLCLLRGLPPSEQALAALDAPGALPEAGAALPQLLPSELLRRRPDIRRAERELAASSADIGVAVAELFPHFSLGAVLGLQSTHLADLVSGSSRYWTLGPAIDWNLFNGGRTRAGIRLQEARRDEAQANYEKTVLAALVEVESALLALQHESAGTQALRDAQQTATENLKLADGRYRAGLSGLLDLLSGERALYQIEDQYVQSRQRVAIAQVALFKALGGGWFPDAADPNNRSAATPAPDRAGDPQP